MKVCRSLGQGSILRLSQFLCLGTEQEQDDIGHMSFNELLTLGLRTQFISNVDASQWHTAINGIADGSEIEQLDMKYLFSIGSFCHLYGNDTTLPPYL